MAEQEVLRIALCFFLYEVGHLFLNASQRFVESVVRLDIAEFRIDGLFHIQLIGEPAVERVNDNQQDDSKG